MPSSSSSNASTPSNRKTIHDPFQPQWQPPSAILDSSEWGKPFPLPFPTLWFVVVFFLLPFRSSSPTLFVITVLLRITGIIYIVRYSATVLIEKVLHYYIPTLRYTYRNGLSEFRGIVLEVKHSGRGIDFSSGRGIDFSSGQGIDFSSTNNTNAIIVPSIWIYIDRLDICFRSAKDTGRTRDSSDILDSNSNNESSVFSFSWWLIVHLWGYFLLVFLNSFFPTHSYRFLSRLLRYQCILDCTGFQLWYRSNHIPQSHHRRQFPLQRNESIPVVDDQQSSSVVHPMVGRENFFITSSIHRIRWIMNWNMRREIIPVQRWIVTDIRPEVSFQRIRFHCSSHGQCTGVQTLLVPQHHSLHATIPDPTVHQHHHQIFSRVEEGTNLSCSVNLFVEKIYGGVEKNNNFPPLVSISSSSSTLPTLTTVKFTLVSVHVQVYTVPLVTVLSFPTIQYTGNDFHVVQRLQQQILRLFSSVGMEARLPSTVPQFFSIEGTGNTIVHFHLSNMYSLYQLHDEGYRIHQKDFVRYPSDILFGSSLSVGMEDRTTIPGEEDPVTTACCEWSTLKEWTLYGSMTNKDVAKVNLTVKELYGSFFSDFDTSIRRETSTNVITNPLIHCEHHHRTCTKIDRTQITWEALTHPSSERPQYRYMIENPIFIWTNHSRAVIDCLIRALPYSFQILWLTIDSSRYPSNDVTTNLNENNFERINRNTVTIDNTNVLIVDDTDPHTERFVVIYIPRIFRHNVSKLGNLRIIERCLVIDSDILIKTISFPPNSLVMDIGEQYIAEKDQLSDQSKLICVVKPPLKWDSTLESLNRIPFHRAINRSLHTFTIPGVHLSLSAEEFRTFQTVLNNVILVSSSVFLSNHYNQSIVAPCILSKPLFSSSNHDELLLKARTVLLKDNETVQNTKMILLDRFHQQYNERTESDVRNVTSRSQTIEWVLNTVYIDLLGGIENRSSSVSFFGKEVILRYNRTKLQTWVVNIQALRIFHHANFANTEIRSRNVNEDSPSYPSASDPLSTYDDPSSTIILSCGSWITENIASLPSVHIASIVHPSLWISSSTNPSSRTRVPILEAVDIAILPSSIATTISTRVSGPLPNHRSTGNNVSIVHFHSVQHSQDGGRPRIVLSITKTNIDFLFLYFGRALTEDDKSTRRSFLRKGRRMRTDNKSTGYTPLAVEEKVEPLLSSSSVPSTTRLSHQNMFKKVAKLTTMAKTFVSRFRNRKTRSEIDPDRRTASFHQPIVGEGILPSDIPMDELTHQPDESLNDSEGSVTGSISISNSSDDYSSCYGEEEEDKNEEDKNEESSLPIYPSGVSSFPITTTTGVANSSSLPSSSSLSSPIVVEYVIIKDLKVSEIPLCLFLFGYGLQLTSIHTTVPSFRLDYGSTTSFDPLSSSTLQQRYNVYEINEFKKRIYLYYRKYLLYKVVPRNLPGTLIKSSLRNLFGRKNLKRRKERSSTGT